MSMMYCPRCNLKQLNAAICIQCGVPTQLWPTAQQQPWMIDQQAQPLYQYVPIHQQALEVHQDAPISQEFQTMTQRSRNPSMANHNTEYDRSPRTNSHAMRRYQDRESRSPPRSPRNQRGYYAELDRSPRTDYRETRRYRDRESRSPPRSFRNQSEHDSSWRQRSHRNYDGHRGQHGDHPADQGRHQDQVRSRSPRNIERDYSSSLQRDRSDSRRAQNHWNKARSSDMNGSRLSDMNVSRPSDRNGSRPSYMNGSRPSDKNRSRPSKKRNRARFYKKKNRVRSANQLQDMLAGPLQEIDVVDLSESETEPELCSSRPSPKTETSQELLSGDKAFLENLGRKDTWCLYHHVSGHETIPDCHESSQNKGMKDVHDMITSNHGWLEFDSIKPIVQTVLLPAMEKNPVNIVQWLDRIALLCKKTAFYANNWVIVRDNALKKLRESLVPRITPPSLEQWDKDMAQSCRVSENLVREINLQCQEATENLIRLARIAIVGLPADAEDIDVLVDLSEHRNDDLPSLGTAVEDLDGQSRDGNFYTAQLERQLSITFSNLHDEATRFANEIHRNYSPNMRQVGTILVDLIIDTSPTNAPFSWSVNLDWREDKLSELRNVAQATGTQQV